MLLHPTDDTTDTNRIVQIDSTLVTLTRPNGMPIHTLGMVWAVMVALVVSSQVDGVVACEIGLLLVLEFVLRRLH